MPAQGHPCKQASLCLGSLRSAVLTLSCTVTRRVPGSTFPCALLPICARSIRARNQCVLGRVWPCIQLAAPCSLISNDEEESRSWSVFLTHFSPLLPETDELNLTVMVLNQSSFCPSGDIWSCLETSPVATSEERLILTSTE